MEQLERVVGDVSGANAALGKVVDELATEAREADAEMSLTT